MTGGRFDELLAEELLSDLAAKRDLQLLNGTGANSQVLGLIGTANTTGYTWTEGSPTGAKLRRAVNAAWSATSAASGTDPTTILWAPRKAALSNETVTREQLPVSDIVSIPAMPINLGAGTEDRIIVTSPSAIAVFTDGEPRVEAFHETGSNTLTVRIRVYQSLALAARRPEQIGLISGSGCATVALG